MSAALVRGYVFGMRIGLPAALAFGLAWTALGHWLVGALWTALSAVGLFLAWSIREPEVCGVESCPGDPLSLSCTLPTKHDGMHYQHGVPCSWEMPEDART